jgi:hypothetical protein
LPTIKPSFIIIGAQKAGTTSFYEYLSYHPQFVKAYTKEVHYFDINYNKGIQWYSEHFPKSIKNLGKFSGEASPYYIYHPLVPERIFKYNPRIKLVCLLRNPVERAYSHYCMNMSRGSETLSFEDAIAQEENRLQGEAERIKARPHHNSFNYQTYSYLGRGRYAEQLKLWFEYFKPQQFFFVNTADILRDPQQVFDRFCGFMGVSQFTVLQPLKLNSHSNTQLLPETRSRLQAYFEPYNKELLDLTGINLNE